jgi:hypothetical protein
MSDNDLDYNIVQRNEFLESIGLEPHEYGVNFTLKECANPLWEEQRSKYGFDVRETWSMDTISVEWLYSHLKMYYEAARDIVDLSWHKYDINGETLTQEQVITLILEYCEEYLLAKHAQDDDTIEKAQHDVKKAFKLYAEILLDTWW